VDPEVAKQVAELEAKTVALTKERSRIESEVQRSEAYRKLASRIKQIRKEQGKLSGEENALLATVCWRYTDDGRRPRYSRSDSYHTGLNTNVSGAVLTAIKDVIGPTSKLKASQVEEIVEELVKIDTSKPEYKRKVGEIDRKRKALTDEDEEAYERQNDLENKATGNIGKQVLELKRQIEELRETARKPGRQVVESIREGYKEKIPELYARLEQTRSSTANQVPTLDS